MTAAEDDYEAIQLGPDEWYYVCRVCEEVDTREAGIVRHIASEHLSASQQSVTIISTSHVNHNHNNDNHKSPPVVSSSQTHPHQPSPAIQVNHRRPSTSGHHNSNKSVGKVSDHSNGGQRKPKTQINGQSVSQSPADSQSSVLPKRPAVGQSVRLAVKESLKDHRPIGPNKHKPQQHCIQKSLPQKVSTNGQLFSGNRATGSRPLTPPHPPVSSDSQSTSNRQSISHINSTFIACTQRFQCPESGCKKTFGFIQSLLLHRRQHEKKVAKSVLNLSANSVRKVGSNRRVIITGQTVIQYPNGMVRIGDESNGQWYRVRRVTDRNLHRHEKESHQHDLNYKGMQSLKPLKQWFRCEPVDGKRHWWCTYPMSTTICQFHTKRSQQLARHIHGCHLRDRQFPCRQLDCSKIYLSPTSLRQHELNHKCGFGILNGKTMPGPCGNRTINHYRQRDIDPNGVRIYRCAICRFTSQNCRSLKRHLHCQHLCPVRIHYVPCEPSPNGHSMPTPSHSSASMANGANNSNDSDDDIEIIGVVMGGSADNDGGADPEVKQLLTDRNVKSCTAEQYERSCHEWERLVRIRPMFDRRYITGADGRPIHGLVCICDPDNCQFSTAKLSAISQHLRFKHFVSF